jgi:hypothetical protein
VFWKDLERRRMLLGLTRVEVGALLGTPEYDRGSYVLYIVKEPDPRELSFNFWYALQLDFDASGRVAGGGGGPCKTAGAARGLNRGGGG